MEFPLDKELGQRAEAYAERRGATMGKELGAGLHGSVFLVLEKDKRRRTAVKFHRWRAPFERERDVYERLDECAVTEVLGHHVPQRLHVDEELMAIQMTIVRRPYLLDFAGGDLYVPRQFSEDVVAKWEEEKREQFGVRWEEVLRVIMALQQYDIFLFDVNPGNITFRDDPSDEPS